MGHQRPMSYALGLLFLLTNQTMRLGGKRENELI